MTATTWADVTGRRRARTWSMRDLVSTLLAMLAIGMLVSGLALILVRPSPTWSKLELVDSRAIPLTFSDVNFPGCTVGAGAADCPRVNPLIVEIAEPLIRCISAGERVPLACRITPGADFHERTTTYGTDTE